jgi:hypothetical protein
MSDHRAQKRVPSDRPKVAAEEPSTVRPPFDPVSYARESDSRLRTETTPPSARPTAPPPPGMPQYTPGASSGTMHALGAVSSGAVPDLAVAREDLEWFELTPYVRSLLRYVDGRQSIEAICARACLKLDEVLATMHELSRDGLVTLRR